MSETSEKLKRMCNHLRRVLKENKKVKQDYVVLDAKASALELEQEFLQDQIKAKQEEIAQADEKKQELIKVLDEKVELNRLSKPIMTYKVTESSWMEKLASSEMYYEDLLTQYTVMREIREEEHEK